MPGRILCPFEGCAEHFESLGALRRHAAGHGILLPLFRPGNRREANVADLLRFITEAVARDVRTQVCLLRLPQFVMLLTNAV